MIYGLASFASFAQIPHLTGSINISIKDKSFSCDLSYDQIPEDFHLLLNQSFNSPSFRYDDRKLQIKKKKNSIHYVDAYQYEIGLDQRDNLQISYNFKESKDELIQNTLTDWKGNLAFTNNTFRATEQSAWYPILYHPTEERQITAISYDIEITCDDCESIFLNGSHPSKSQVVRLTSKKPSSLLIFAGEFDFENVERINLINSPLTDGENHTILTFVKEVKAFYESKLHVSYDRDLSLLSASPTSLNDAWLFVTYPTIAIIGNGNLGMKGWVQDGELDYMRVSSLSHELGHYYLGNIFQPRGPLFWIFLEGFAEYLSLQANRQILGEEHYNQLLLRYKSQVQGLAFKPLPQITHQDEVDGTYRYAYVPLLLTAIEKEIGKDSMWQWMQQIISYKDTATSDYAFFKKTFIESGLTERLFTDIETKFITGSKTGIHIDSTIFNLRAE